MSTPGADTMDGRDVYLKITGADGSFAYVHHRAWNRDRYLRSVTAAHAKEGAKVEAVDRETYENWRSLQKAHA